MNRTQVVLAVLQWDLPNGFELRLRSDDKNWLAGHAGGFSPVSWIENRAVYDVDPDRVVEVGAHLSDETFTRFVETVRVFQKHTAGDYMFRLAPDLVVAKFCQNFPAEGRFLTAVAAHHDLDPVAFFGADNYPASHGKHSV